MTKGAQLSLLVTQKFTSGLSIIGSSMIILQVWRNKKNRQDIQQRIIMARSIIDLITSITWFSTNFFMPKNYGHYFYGNERTCVVQGFIVQFSISGILYNSILSFYYLLVIKYGWCDIELKKIEPWMHAFPLSVGLTTAMVALFKDLYHPANWDCWIGPPPECEPNDTSPMCTRHMQYGMFFFFYILWAAILMVTLLTGILYFTVKNREQKVAKYRTRRRTFDTTQCLVYSKQVFRQSQLYVGAFYITWICASIFRILQLATKGEFYSDWLFFLSGSFICVQGFFDALVFFRPRALKCRLLSGRSWFLIAWILFKATVLTCCCNISYTDDDKDLFKRPNNYKLSTRSIVTSMTSGDLNELNNAKNKNIFIRSDCEKQEENIPVPNSGIDDDTELVTRPISDKTTSNSKAVDDCTELHNAEEDMSGNSKCKTHKDIPISKSGI
mmetsp:Transcript_49348/g.96507  ORF Transcript_49348/g.96507 Transcript_49348/m.96507 type:complete len:442 (-) Transcript_49348:60-1385(-)